MKDRYVLLKQGDVYQQGDQIRLCSNFWEDIDQSWIGQKVDIFHEYRRPLTAFLAQKGVLVSVGK